MALVTFTQQLARYVACPDLEVGGSTLAEALDEAFIANPQVKHYIVDEHGRLRRHVAVFIDGRRVRDAALAAAVGPATRVHILQALTGG